MKIVSKNFTVSAEFLTFLFLLILFIFASFTYISMVLTIDSAGSYDTARERSV